MRTTTIFYLLTLFFGQVGLAQTDSLRVDRIVRTSINYKSFVTTDNKLFAINDSGQVVIWDLSKLDTIHFAHNDTSFRYTSIAKDRHNQIFIGTNTGSIFKVSPSDLSYSLFLQDKYPVYAICFNALDKMFLIVPGAVYEPVSKKHWNKFENHASGVIYRKRVMGLFWLKTDRYFSMPQFTYLDSLGRWWMCKSYGEFGGETQIFDTKYEKIYDNKLDSIDTGLFFPKSVFNDDKGNTYITSGLQHGINTGEIYKLDTNRFMSKIYNSDDYRDTSRIRNVYKEINGDYDGLFVGPGAYNKTDNSIYFATTNGFYKATLPTSGKLPKPQLVFNPMLSRGREALAMGVGMTVKQMEFTTDNKLIFLTTYDGIGVYYNNQLVLLK